MKTKGMMMLIPAVFAALAAAAWLGEGGVDVNAAETKEASNQQITLDNASISPQFELVTFPYTNEYVKCFGGKCGFNSELIESGMGWIFPYGGLSRGIYNNSKMQKTIFLDVKISLQDEKIVFCPGPRCDIVYENSNFQPNALLLHINKDNDKIDVRNLSPVKWQDLEKCALKANECIVFFCNDYVCIRNFENNKFRGYKRKADCYGMSFNDVRAKIGLPEVKECWEIPYYCLTTTSKVYTIRANNNSPGHFSKMINWNNNGIVYETDRYGDRIQYKDFEGKWATSTEKLEVRYYFQDFCNWESGNWSFAYRSVYCSNEVHYVSKDEAMSKLKSWGLFHPLMNAGINNNLEGNPALGGEILATTNTCESMSTWTP